MSEVEACEFIPNKGKLNPFKQRDIWERPLLWYKLQWIRQAQLKSMVVNGVV